MDQINERLGELGVVPVVVLEDANNAKPLAKALVNGGLPCAEVTFRTEAAEESIRIMAKAYPDMLIGAGTVLTVSQAKKALDAGAKFIVSPGFDEEIVDYCINKNIPVFPGCITPSEIAGAIKKGLSVLKFFPSEQFGGLGTVKALAAPYTAIKFMPTGGINAKNLKEYLSCDKVICCGGSWIAGSSLVKAQEFKQIQKLAAEAAELVKSIRRKSE